MAKNYIRFPDSWSYCQKKDDLTLRERGERDTQHEQKKRGLFTTDASEWSDKLLPSNPTLQERHITTIKQLRENKTRLTTNTKGKGHHHHRGSSSKSRKYRARKTENQYWSGTDGMACYGLPYTYPTNNNSSYYLPGVEQC